MTTSNFMSNPTYMKVHNRFKLNGATLTADDLCRVAYSFIKEGDDFEKPVGDFILDWFDEKPYIDMLTSGSTGIPKTIRVQKQSMVNSAIATGNYFDLNPGDKVLNCLPVKYVAGKMMFVRSFILGLEMEFVAPSSHPLAKNELTFDFSAMVPLQAQNSLNQLHVIKKLIVGGAKINAKLEQDLLNLKTDCYETFGMTEAVSHIAAKKVGEKAFTALEHVSISTDERSCLVITAPSVTENPIVTNDLVEIVAENQFVFLGRMDNIVNSGGIKLIPEQIEAKLANHISQRFFVIGVPDADLGEKLILVIEGAKFEFDKTIFDVLDKYEKPKDIVFIEKFKETPNGKIIRRDSLN
jgi:o-succinylbenzoate---CoA ligase